MQLQNNLLACHPADLDTSKHGSSAKSILHQLRSLPGLVKHGIMSDSTCSAAQATANNPGPPGVKPLGQEQDRICVPWFVGPLLGVCGILIWLLKNSDSSLAWFLFLFAFKYFRQAVHLVAFLRYRPAPRPAHPTYTSRDVTVVLPTVDPGNPWFQKALINCCANGPRQIVIVTAGETCLGQVRQCIAEMNNRFGLEASHPHTTITVTAARVANKRQQIAHAMQHVDTKITVLMDDRVMWGPNFLRSVLDAFENPKVGFVGTNKRVIRPEAGRLFERIWGMIGCLYLERHNHEIRASNTACRGGGVFVVSGRTSAIRTAIISSAQFLSWYTDERFFFGLFGPLNADDDNALTRYVVRTGWDIKIQYTADAMITTTLGTSIHSKLFR